MVRQSPIGGGSTSDSGGTSDDDTADEPRRRAVEDEPEPAGDTTDDTTDTDDTPRERAVEQEPEPADDTDGDTTEPDDTPRERAVEQEPEPSDDTTDGTTAETMDGTDAIATGIEEGGVETEQTLDRLTGPGTASFELTDRAGEIEQRITRRTAADPEDVRIDIRERDGGLAFVPVYSPGFRRQQRAGREIDLSRRVDQSVGRATSRFAGRREAAQEQAERQATEALQEQTGRGAGAILSGVSAVSQFTGGLFSGDESEVQQAAEEFTPPGDVAEERAISLGVAEEDITAEQTEEGVRAEFTEEFLSERREAAEESAQQSVIRQIEEETGADLDEQDVEFVETDAGGFRGELTAEGEEAVAVAETPLRDVPGLGGVLTAGSRVRTRFRQATDPAAEWWEENTPSEGEVFGGLAAAAPVAAAEPTPFGEISLGTAAAAGGVVFGTAAAVGYARGGGPDETATRDAPERAELQQAVTAQLGEVPTPEEAGEPFPTEIPAPTQPASEPFPEDIRRPERTSDPFAPEQEAPTQPSEPFPEDISAPEETAEPFPEDTPPIDPEVGETIGGPAGFAGPVQEGLIEQREEDGPTIIGEDIPRFPFDPGTIGRGATGGRRINEPRGSGISRRYRRAQEREVTVEDEGPGRTVEGQRVLTFPGEQSRAEQLAEQAAEAQVQADYTDVFGREAQTPVTAADVRPETQTVTDSVLAQDQVQTEAVQQQQAQQERLRQADPTVSEPAFPTTPVQGPGFGFPPDYGFPEEPGFPQGPGFGYGPPTYGRCIVRDEEGRCRPALDIDAGAQEGEDAALEAESAPVLTAFADPLTGELTDVQANEQSGRLPEWLL